ncbi:hypothetical protein D3C84_974820 [compost metagenome]
MIRKLADAMACTAPSVLPSATLESAWIPLPTSSRRTRGNCCWMKPRMAWPPGMASTRPSNWSSPSRPCSELRTTSTLLLLK